MTTETPRPRMPRKLGKAGRDLWQGITDPEEGWALRPDEIRLLTDACREADIVERLETALADAELIVRGSMGQPAPSPLLTEIRQHRATLAGLLGKLRLVEPDEDEDEVPTGTLIPLTRAEAARKAARTRWAR